MRNRSTGDCVLLFYTAVLAITLHKVPTRSTREDPEGLLVKPYGLGSSTPSGGAGVLKKKETKLYLE